jgi:hypothetical protein
VHTLRKAPAGHVGRTYLLTGPQLLAFISAIAAGTPACETRSDGRSLIAEGDAAWLSQDVRTILGRSARSFEQFATDYAAAFTPGG